MITVEFGEWTKPRNSRCAPRVYFDSIWLFIIPSTRYYKKGLILYCIR